MRFQGRLYRAPNPVYAREPLPGRGAALYGGRFNPRGMPALYASLSVMTALREANQAGHLQPVTLVCYDADIGAVFDARDEAALKAFGMEPPALADPGWRDRMAAEGKAPTQIFAETLAGQGFHGLLVRSFAPGTSADDLNLVLWRWGATLPARLALVNNEDRLGVQR